MQINITPITFTGGQRVKIKITNNMDDYKKGFQIGSTMPKDKVDIELRKYSSNPKYSSLVSGILDGLGSLVSNTKKKLKLETGNYKGKI